jgi:predicted RNase H-like HicB family nuclease
MKQNYPAIVYGEVGDYDIVFPDFPGCVSGGADLEGVFKNAQEALDLHLAGMSEDGADIPAPSGLADIRTEAKDLEIKDYEIIQVTGLIPEKAVRVNITIPEWALCRIDKAAKEIGLNRSKLLTKAALQFVG